MTNTQPVDSFYVGQRGGRSLVDWSKLVVRERRSTRRTVNPGSLGDYSIIT